MMMKPQYLDNIGAEREDTLKSEVVMVKAEPMNAAVEHDEYAAS